MYVYMGALAAAAHLVLVYCVTLVAHTPPEEPHPVAKSKIELKPLEIKCELTDFVIISAPVTKAKEIRYFLYRPNGQSQALNITALSSSAIKYVTGHKPIENTYDEYNDIEVKFIERQSPVIIPHPQFEVFNANKGLKSDAPDIFGMKKAAMKENDFMLGPLDYGDYGNWVLSLYFRGDQREWMEAFQVITLHITETVPAQPFPNEVRLGTDFSLQFAYPIEDIETCQLNVPTSTFDRFYSTNGIDRKYCGYIVRNATKRDSGLWEIVGVGKIVYEANILLEVIP